MKEHHPTPLARKEPARLTRDEWAMIEAIAPALSGARFYAGILKPEQAAVVCLKGYELGLPLAASFEYIHVIEGRPSLSPMGALAILRRSGDLESIEIAETDAPIVGCTVTMQRRGGERYSVTWTVRDAEQAELVKPKSNWAKYPKNMCRWRAIGYCADYLFPDVLGGLKRADELGAEITPDGQVIEAEWAPSPDRSSPPSPAEPAANATPPPAPEHAAVVPTLDELVNRYGADRVMIAAGGTIPGTDEEVTLAAGRLAETEETLERR